MVYLADVVFEHLNVSISAAGKRENVVNPKIQALDTVLFYELARFREELALSLASRIDAKCQSDQVFERGRNPLGPTL